MSLTASELSAMRDHLEEILPDTCTIQTRSWQADGMGGGSYTWSDTYTNVKCRLAARPYREREEVSGGRLTVHSVWVLTLPWDQAIDETMRVVHDGETYEVVAVDDTHSERACRRADVVRVG